MNNSDVHSWPPEGLERVDSCPVCGGEERVLLHEGLRDRVFFCAPGVWTLYRCVQCRSGFLDPRPTLSTIGIAYRTYFTHSAEISGRRNHLRRALANGYRNHRFGTSEQPAYSLGIALAWLSPGSRQNIEASMRHMPKPTTGARLLDLGCGNGDFLARAKSIGWDVVGVDFDPTAVTTARERGLDVRLGGVDELTSETGKFDGITLSHFIEHVHNPTTTLAACHRLLKSGGWLWLETPNLESIGHDLYGPFWRGLEPPRHLVLFNYASLRRALEEAHFVELQDQPYRPLCTQLFSASAAIEEQRNPISSLWWSLLGFRRARRAEQIARLNPARREFMTLVAHKHA